jgi:hypothetical protein
MPQVDARVKAYPRRAHIASRIYAELSHLILNEYFATDELEKFGCRTRARDHPIAGTTRLDGHVNGRQHYDVLSDSDSKATRIRLTRLAELTGPCRGAAANSQWHRTS